MFINHEYIYKILEETKNPSNEQIKEVLNRAKNREGLDYKDIAILLQAEDEKDLKEIYSLAGEIKKDIYGKRVVVFAPLYVSDYCVNNCVYCGYKRDNKFNRRRLTMEEVAQEVKILEQMGHKRLALELGEDPVNAPIDYVLECLDTIYKTQNNNGEIRRVNVNIAATTVENYKLLKEKGIGTYILFQETYHKPTYDKMHPKSLKGDYNYHLTAFDRAMEAGIDDVGAGVLFGLADPRFEVLGLMMHNAHLEEKFGVVGGYKEREEGKEVKQFKTNDERSPIEILKELLSDGYIPSYCTACYRKGRTGDRFMSLAKSGNIKYVCEPNALMTLLEFTLDYGDEELYKKSLEIIDKEVENIEREDIKSLTKESMEKMKKGQRDFYL